MHQIKTSHKLQDVFNVRFAPKMNYRQNKNKNPLLNIDASNLWYHSRRKTYGILNVLLRNERHVFLDHAYIYTVHNTTYIHIHILVHWTDKALILQCSWEMWMACWCRWCPQARFTSLKSVTSALSAYAKVATWHVTFNFTGTSSTFSAIKTADVAHKVSQTGEQTGSMVPRNCCNVYVIPSRVFVQKTTHFPQQEGSFCETFGTFLLKIWKFNS